MISDRRWANGLRRSQGTTSVLQRMGFAMIKRREAALLQFRYSFSFVYIFSHFLTFFFVGLIHLLLAFSSILI